MPKPGDGSGEYKNTDKNQQTQGGNYNSNLKFDFGDDNFFFINDDE